MLEKNERGSPGTSVTKEPASPSLDDQHSSNIPVGQLICKRAGESTRVSKKTAQTGVSISGCPKQLFGRFPVNFRSFSYGGERGSLSVH